MHAHQYTFDFHQVSRFLNKQSPKEHEVTPDMLKEWADQQIFPIKSTEPTYRIGQEALPIIEETRELILVQGYDLLEAKKILQNTLKEKENFLNNEENWKVLSQDNMLQLHPLFEQLNDLISQTATGNIIALTDTEVALKGAIIHSEVRMKNVMERVEKRMQQHMDDMIENILKNQRNPEKELQNLLFELEETIQKHQIEILGIKRLHQKEISQLKEEQERQVEKVKEEANKQYEELLQAGFFKRLKLKKQYKR